MIHNNITNTTTNQGKNKAKTDENKQLEQFISKQTNKPKKGNLGRKPTKTRI